MDLSIVIPTWRGRELLEAYLPSVLAAADCYRKQSGCTVEVVIVDDAGGDDSVDWVTRTYGDRITCVQHEHNQGFPAACQTGFEAARFPVVLLLNNDVRLEPGCIGPMIEHFSDPEVFAVTGKMYNQAGDRFCNGGKIARFRRGMWSTYENYDVRPGTPADLTLLSFTAIGAFSAYDRRKYLELGGFEPLTAMVEDVDLSYRGWKRGWTVKYEPRSVAYHDASRTMDRRYRRRQLDKLSRRNWIIMHWMLLHDRRMLATHISVLAARFLVSWLILDWRFYWAVFSGLSRIEVIATRRRHSRSTMVRNDRELLRTLEHFYSTAPIAPRKE